MKEIYLERLKDPKERLHLDVFKEILTNLNNGQHVWVGDCHFNDNYKYFIKELLLYTSKLNPKPPLYMEMVEASKQPVLDGFKSGHVTQDELAKCISKNSNGNDVWCHTPNSIRLLTEIIAECKILGVPVVGIDCVSGASDWKGQMRERNQCWANTIANTGVRGVIFGGIGHSHSAINQTEEGEKGIEGVDTLLGNVFVIRPATPLRDGVSIRTNPEGAPITIKSGTLLFPKNYEHYFKPPLRSKL